MSFTFCCVSLVFPPEKEYPMLPKRISFQWKHSRRAFRGSKQPWVFSKYRVARQKQEARKWWICRQLYLFPNIRVELRTICGVGCCVSLSNGICYMVQIQNWWNRLQLKHVLRVFHQIPWILRFYILLKALTHIKMHFYWCRICCIALFAKRNCVDENERDTWYNSYRQTINFLLWYCYFSSSFSSTNTPHSEIIP